MKMIPSVFVLALSLAAGSALAKSPVMAADDFDPTPTLAPAEFDAKFAEEAAKKWKEAGRSPASANFSESSLSADFKKFRTAYLKVKTADELEGLLSKGEAEFDHYSRDLQFFMAQLLLIREYRGIVWRLRPLFEYGRSAINPFQGSKATHSFAVSAVRFVASTTKINLPTAQWAAGFEYLTVPSKEMTSKSQFSNMFQFQNYLNSVGAPAIAKALSRIKAVYRADSQATYVWDNQLLYGSGTFDDGIHRYVGFSAPEMNIVIANLHMAVHGINLFGAYNQSRIVAASEKLGKMIGMDGYTSDDLGVTSQERRKILNSFNNDSDQLWRLRVSSKGQAIGKTLMANAFSHLTAAIAYYDTAHDRLQGARESSGLVLNPLFYQDANAPAMKRGLANVKAMIEKKTSVRSAVTGEVIEIDLPTFYRNPPTNLLALMPTMFEGGQPEMSVTNKSGEKLTYRNYYQGRPIGWDNNEWKKYIPSAAGKNPAYIATAARTLRMSAGANLLAWPLTAFVQ